MLEIELGPLEKNKEGELKVRKAPAWRYAFWITVAALWAACLPPILAYAASSILAALVAIGVLAALALVVWYCFTNRVSGFHSAGLNQMVLGSTTTYQYRVQGGLIHRASAEGNKSWKPGQFVGSEVCKGYALIIFRAAVCYLPFRGADRQQVIDFVEEVEQLAAGG